MSGVNHPEQDSEDKVAAPPFTQLLPTGIITAQ